MTIFDTLRYPISTPPTEAELAALPRSLYARWLKYTRWPTSPSAYIVASFYNDIQLITSDSGKIYNDELILLRKMIRDYEPV